MNDSFLDTHMRKALAQNPNLLRTLIGLGLTLILLLAYAVYGATINTEIYVYESNSNETVVSLDDAERYYSPDDNTTTWTWDADLNGVNLTWVNLTVVSLSSGSIIAISNGEGLYSHPDLGNPDADEFSCTESCKKRIEHRTNSTGETTSIISLTNPDPAIRGKGSVYADSQEEASKKATKILNSTFEPTKVRITIIEEGNRTVNPSVELTQVNESLYNVEMFEVDAATEFLWALAAVIGCFSMVLVPSFTVYFAARAKQKKTELKLESARINIEEE
tara:strand:- start:304 stop:1134 length:831 start_codon:yes stop_codon:yes gene_type:complete